MKILEITSELDGGGVDRLLYDYCSRLIPDVQFDFVATSKFEGMLEQPLKDLGCNVYHIAQLREDLKLHKKQLSEILENGQYDIIHDHSGYKAYFNLKLAKKLGVKGRIAHSHIAYIPESAKNRLQRKIVTLLTKVYATDLFACGRDAAKWMWGEKDDVYIMTNAIHTERFAFSEETRNRIRKELGLEGKFVIGDVARFSYQKNHEFLIRIFAQVKKLRSDAVLVLIGRGELEDDVKQQVKDMGLTDSVIFMGVRNDVPELLNALDIFLLPSRFEGLPVTVVEVQANGLATFAADTITDEIKLLPNVNYLPLEMSAAEWAKAIVKADISRIMNGLSNSKYDIEYAVNSLKDRYEKINTK